MSENVKLGKREREDLSVPLGTKQMGMKPDSREGRKFKGYPGVNEVARELSAVLPRGWPRLPFG